MGERILELALAAGGGDRALLEPLCNAAVRAWTARLREGLTAEDCGEAFPCAAAFTAAADLAALGEPLTIVGDGAALCGDFFREQNISCRLAPVHLRLQSAVGVGLAACRLWPDGAVAPQALAPVYLRLSQAERERLEREKAT